MAVCFLQQAEATSTTLNVVAYSAAVTACEKAKESRNCLCHSAACGVESWVPGIIFRWLSASTP